MLSERLEEVACPLCEADDANVWAKEGGYTAVKCRACGLVYVNPRPPEEAVEETVKLGEFQTEDGTLNARFRRQQATMKFFRPYVVEMYADLIKAQRPVTWLDVGAGYGEFVEVLIDVLPKGSEVRGVEPMEHKAQTAAGMGLPISNGDIACAEGEHDVISLMNVFSHIPVFSEFLDQARTKLKPKGELFILTGNAGDLERRSDFPNNLQLPDHLVFAGERHIETFLSKAGFEMVSKSYSRADTPINFAKNVVKYFMGRPGQVVIPYTSGFRRVFYRARLA